MNVRDNINEGKYKNNKSIRTPDSKEEKRAKFEAYMEEERRLNDLFQKDLEEEHGVVGHKKADRLFQIAWQLGHAHGYSEVCCYYEDIVELIQ